MSSSDAAYSAFLDKANEDPSANTTSSSSSSEQWPDLLSSSSVKATSIPPSLQNLQAVYVSETDEEFQPVAFSLGGKEGGKARLDVEGLKALVQEKFRGQVVELGVEEWDPRGKYGEVVRAVEEAAEGGVKVFRVGEGRVVYFVVAKMKKGEGEGEGDEVVGVKVRAVET